MTAIPSTLPEHLASVRRAVAVIPVDVPAAWRVRYLADEGSEMPRR